MREILDIAEKERYAVPCINTPNMETLRAVVDAAEELNTPVIIDHAQVHDSVIPIEKIGPEMVKYAKQAKVPVCVHLDHGVDFNFVMKAIRLGFSSIMYDCSALPFEENMKNVKDFVRIAKELDITVEAELGVMASSDEDTHGDAESRVLTNEDIKEYFTDPEEAGKFARETGCDALAVCFGTMHGIYAEPPVLDIERVKEIDKNALSLISTQQYNTIIINNKLPEISDLVSIITTFDEPKKIIESQSNISEFITYDEFIEISINEQIIF